MRTSSDRLFQSVVALTEKKFILPSMFPWSVFKFLEHITILLQKKHGVAASAETIIFSYMNDILRSVKRDKIEDLQSKCNGLHKNLEFTMEEE